MMENCREYCEKYLKYSDIEKFIKNKLENNI